MQNDEVFYLKLPYSYKWVYKTKKDSKGEWFKTRLDAKGFTEYGGVEINKTFSLVSSKIF